MDASESVEAVSFRGKRLPLSVVVPVYNEQEVIREFHHRLCCTLDEANIMAEIVYVNDGSTDGSLEILLALRNGDSSVQVIDLTRNFGKEIAMTAGLDHAVGDAVVLIDADLQDPPEMIPDMVREWRNGYDVVYMKRISRRGESRLRRLTARAFYRVIHHVTKFEIPENIGDFRLLSRRAVAAVKQMPRQFQDGSVMISCSRRKPDSFLTTTVTAGEKVYSVPSSTEMSFPSPRFPLLYRHMTR